MTPTIPTKPKVNPPNGDKGSPVVSYIPHSWQRQIHAALADYRFVVAIAHRRFGKTECAVESLVVAASMETRPDGMYGYIAPYLKQAKQIAWRKLKRRVLQIYGKDWKALGIQKNEAELWIELPNGARIQLFGADNADAIRGLYFDGIVIDEIADMKADVWSGIIRPALADRMGWALMIGTPKGMNELYKFYQRGLKDKLWKSMIFPVTVTKLPWMPPEEVKAMQNDMTDAMFRQEMLCDFQASSDDVLFKLDLIHESINRALKLSDITGAARVIGFDVGGAEKGSDESIIMKKQGLNHWPVQKYKGLDTTYLCDVLAHEMTEWKADAAFIDKGYGFAIIEQMHRRGFFNVYGVDFGGTPIMPHYANKVTEMAYRALACLKAGGKIPNDPKFIEELSVNTVSMDDKGKLIILPKKKIKEKIKRSPDRRDAFFLCNAADVIPLTVNVVQNGAGSGNIITGGYLAPAQQTDYDPYQDEV